MTMGKYRVIVWGHENVWGLVRGGDCTLPWTQKATASHTLRWFISLSVRIYKSELEHMMSKKGFKPGEVGSLPGAHFLTEAARGHTHLTLLASCAAGGCGRAGPSIG